VAALRLGNISLDCDDVMKVATFWSAALGRPLDDWSGPGFASIGTKDPARAAPAWYFAKVPEPKRAKNRMHVDLVSADPATIDELMRLGATVAGEHEVPGGGHRWTVLADPEGNEFCIADRSFTGGA
jgi:predicted enzyme related to lactoylglutathione lyase